MQEKGLKRGPEKVEGFGLESTGGGVVLAKIGALPPLGRILRFREVSK